MRIHHILVFTVAVLGAGCITVHHHHENPELQAQIRELELRLLTEEDDANLTQEAKTERVESQFTELIERLNAQLAAQSEAIASLEAQTAEQEAELAEATARNEAQQRELLLTQPSAGYEHEGFGFFAKRAISGLEKNLTSGDNTKDERYREDLLGKPLPQTRFLGPDGSVVNLTDFNGDKNVLLVFLRGFAGQVCIGCTIQTAILARNQEQFEAIDTQVVLVYPGDASSVAAFLDAVKDYESNFELPYPVLLDVSLGAVRLLDIEGSLAQPTSIIVDKAGVVRYAYAGKSYSDRPSVTELLDAASDLNS